MFHKHISSCLHEALQPPLPDSRQNTGASRCKEQSKPLGSRSLKPITSGLKRAFHCEDDGDSGQLDYTKC